MRCHKYVLLRNKKRSPDRHQTLVAGTEILLDLLLSDICLTLRETTVVCPPQELLIMATRKAFHRLEKKKNVITACFFFFFLILKEKPSFMNHEIGVTFLQSSR